MNYVSFSLWGDQPIYNVGAIRNAELMKTIYSDWKMIVYYDNTVPSETIDKLKELIPRINDNTSISFQNTTTNTATGYPKGATITDLK